MSARAVTPRNRKPPYRFIATITFILALLHALVGWSLLPDLLAPAWVRLLGVAWLTFSWLVLPLTIISRFIRHRGLADALGWVGSVTLGFFSSLLVLTVIRDIFVGIAMLFVHGAGPQEAQYWSAAGVPCLAFFITLIGFVNARRRARVVDIAVPIENLPPELEGFTIVQISDIHVGPTIKRGYLARIVEAVNQLDPDIVAVTGDVVDGKPEHLASHVAPLAQLKARYGVYFVNGNHEYYSGEPAWSNEFARLGLKVLKDHHEIIVHKGVKLLIAGVTDYTAEQFIPEERSDPAKAIEDAPADAAVRILLAHQPRSADAAAGAGFDLQLSGHTHGGQFWPWNYFVRLQQPYTAGLHPHGKLWVYVSRGTGYWGPPKRFGAPSEITRIRLTRGAKTL